MIPPALRPLLHTGFAALVLLLTAASPPLRAQAPNTFATTGSLATARNDHTATLLNNGKVLVAGGNGNSGPLNSVELYDPAAGTWTATGPLNTARTQHTATLLANGKVLVAGGFGNAGNLTSAELYDPVSGTWSPAAPLAANRDWHTATLLSNGKVLVVGGNGNGGLVASAELYNPTTNSWTPAGSLAAARYLHAATVLGNGKVLVAGGIGNAGNLASTELYDPSTNAWTATGSMSTPRQAPTVTLLAEGTALAAAGYNSGYLATAERYNPVTGTWTLTGSLATARNIPTATLLTNGRVLVAGGYFSNPVASAELFDAGSGTWTSASSMVTARYRNTATLLPNGKVLMAGGLGSGGVLLSAELYTPADTVTLAPVLTSPSAGSTFAGNVDMDFTLPEAALGGSVKLTFDNGAGTVRVVTLTASHQSAGTHAFALPSPNLTGSTNVASATGGSSIPDGVYTVTLSYQDAAGNAPATASRANVTIYSSPTPAGSYSPNGYGPGTPASQGYYVPSPGSTQATPAPAGTWAGITGLARVRAAGAARNASQYIVGPVWNSTPASEATIALGTVSGGTQIVTIKVGNATPDAATPAALTDLVVNAVQITGPGASQLLTSVQQPSTLGAGTEADVAFTLTPGAPGSYSATITFQTDIGAAPGGAGETHTFTVTWSVAPVDPTTEALFSKGGAVPGAGSDPRIATGALFTSFGVPSINDAGQIAYLAKWVAPKNGTTPAQSGIGLFAGNPAQLVVKVGDAAGTGVTFASFKDPVLNADGKIAFSAKLKGATVTSANNTALFTNAFSGGEITLVAQKGAVADAADGATLKSFTSLSLQGSEVLYTASLAGGSPLVTSANSHAAYQATASATMQVVRAGQSFGSAKVKAFKLLAAVSGSPGQNRAHTEGSAAFLVLLSDGSQALVDGANGSLTAFVRTGDATGGATLPTATFKSFGPVAAPDTRYSAMAAVLQSGIGGVASADAKGIFLGDDNVFEPVARAAGPTGIAGVTFHAFRDPVLAPETGALAFPATIRGTGFVTSADDATLWWKPAGGDLTLLAREGAQPAETGAGVKWKAFTSLAISGGAHGAPLFTASLVQGAGGVDATNDVGLWAVDSTGALRLIVREGGTINGKTVKSFTALKAVAGSAGVTRSFNNAGQIIYRAIFTDASQALMGVQLP